jgi:hypothetical protein
VFHFFCHFLPFFAILLSFFVIFFVNFPIFTIKNPNYIIKTPNYTIKTPKFTIKIPKFTIKTPNFTIKTPKFTIKIPKFPIKTPYLNPLVAMKDAKIMNLIEGTDLRTMLLKHQTELDGLARGHAREMERERVKAYDSDDFNDIFGIGGAF